MLSPAMNSVRYNVLHRPLLCMVFCLFLTYNAKGAVNWRTVSLGGDSYVPLQELARFYGMRYRVLSKTELSLESKWSRITFEKKSRKCTLNGVHVWLHRGLVLHHKRWYISDVDVADVIDPVMRPHLHVRGQGDRVIVLDPGHGGRDNGAEGRRKVQEKRVALDVARRLRVLLVNRGFRVYMTRTGDHYLSLDERIKKAAAWNADLFVSIHLNAASASSAEGVETYVITSPPFPSTNASDRDRRYPSYKGNRFSHASAPLAYEVQEALIEHTGASDRGVRRARFYVLKNAPCPAILVEGGFLSNHIEESRMIDANYRASLALGIYSGIMEYMNAVRRSRLATP